ncbi:hypothetical protein DYB25_004368 [Aphanomyces astaci]|uniref:Myb-like domain-containing protein n=1 Tax=Aphanomyces astaci TaxID=112090 RepID=A0A397DA72_APHAT|nr:hypothetical protein DYB25_004368 [Aphanomyces astaci]RHY59061.1 hypothetical protein DYB38_002219 [Aphanomyces astaci]RHZ17013.1 hypothetical protein DYB31_006284 [Aphanomyces astaci]RHZ27193.1 hypothetical protein DYB26_015778 [Aphanomyces astaci]
MRPQSSKRVKSTARRATDQAHEDEPGSNDVVLVDLSPEERTMRSPPTANAKTWWSEDDDLLLLIQTNIERPFLALKNKMMAWNDTAAGCMRIDGFGRKSLNGKKASQRFQLLLENHRQFQAKSKFMSGGTQKETEKTVLLDELLALMDDNKAVKEEQHVAEAAGKEKKASATALIRDEAMQRAAKRKSVDGDDDGSSTSKKKTLVDLQNAEIRLEQQKLEYKSKKLEADIQEQTEARKERAEMREIELKKHADMMELIRLSLSKH